MFDNNLVDNCFKRQHKFSEITDESDKQILAYLVKRQINNLNQKENSGK